MGGAGETATFMIRNGYFEVSVMCNVLVVSSLNFCTSQSHCTGKPIYLLTKLSKQCYCLDNFVNIIFFGIHIYIHIQT